MEQQPSRIRLRGLPELCIIAYAFMDGLAPRGVVMWQISFALVFGATALFVLVNTTMFRRSLLGPKSPDWFFITILITGALYGALQTPFFLNYYAGDMALFALGYFYYAYLRDHPERFNDTIIKRLSFWVGVTCLVSFVSSQLALFPQFQQGTRFDYPRVLAAVGLGYAVIVSKGSSRLWYLAAFGGLVILALMCGWRASLAFILIGAALIVLGSLNRQRRLLLVIICAYLAIFPFVFRAEILGWLEDLAQGTRYALLFRETGDDSFLGRVQEAQDVAYYFTNTFSFYEQIFGRGHGATFAPIKSFPEDNITTGWVVHNIHFNIFLMLYRYGAVGVLAYAGFAALVLKEVFVVIFAKSDLLKTPRGAAAFFGLGVLALSANYTPLNEPSNLYCIAAVMALFAVRKREAAVSANPLATSGPCATYRPIRSMS